MSEYKPMQKKTIKSECRKKINSWLYTIDDEQLVKDIKNNVMITGGSIASMLMGEKVNDFDIYFKSVKTAEKVANFYVDKFEKNNKKHLEDDKIGAIKVFVENDRVKLYIKSSGVTGGNGNDDSDINIERPLEEAEEEVYDFFEQTSGDQAEEYINSLKNKAANVKDKKFQPIFLTENAITLTSDLQIITRFTGDPEQIHKNYDFVHCTGCYTYWDDTLHLNEDILESIRVKRLIYQGSLYPICSMIRTRKFIKRGWDIDAGQYLKMAWQISQLELNNVNTLKDQLIGVDAAYFNELINHLSRDKAKGKDINQLYISSLIDKIFNDNDEQEV